MKLAARIAAAVLSFALLSVLALMLAIPYFLEGEQFRRTVAEELSNATGLTATVGKLSFSLPKGIGVRLQNFELIGENGQSLIRSEEIYLGIRALPLLKKKLIVHQDRKSTRLNSSHIQKSRMPSSA